MFALFLALSPAPIPVGAYAMPELCRRLTEATGITHVADATLRDYPVFVSAKSGEPKRVEQLVAAALHAQWQDEGGKFRLVGVKPKEEPDRAEFERLYLQACGADKVRKALPLKDLYRMPIGQIYRYGARPTETVRKLEGIGDGIAVRRLAAGVFEFGGNDQISFKGLPEAVEARLGEDGERVVLDAAARHAIQRRVSDPQVAPASFTEFDKQDPMATMAEPVLKPAAAAMEADLALVLPDFTVFPVMEAGESDGKVRSILSNYAQLLDWAVVDGAVVGRLTMSERLYSTQTRRGVLRDLVKNAGANGVANAAALGRYVAEQRPGASDSWCDAGLLTWSGVVLDQEDVGHYPFNMRLYTRLTPADWAMIRTGEPFLASGLSLASQRALRDLLLQSRESIGGKRADPGFWPTVHPARLSIQAELKEAPVLIGWTGMGAEVYEIKNSSWQYDMRKRKLGREPLYLPATRRSLKLTITLVGGVGLQAETGFSEIAPMANTKPAVWEKLPAAIAEEFGTELEKVRKANQEQKVGGDPPPPEMAFSGR